MTYADILILLRAGYTKEEIDAMDQPETKPADSPPEVPAEKPAPETKPADSPPEVPAEKPAPEAQPVDPTQQILQQLTELVRSMQAQNRESAEIRGNIIEPGAQAMDTLMSLGGIPAAPDNK